ncbi:MAG: ABC transporter ATP-binding protein [Ruminococcaceae bacterium]|nr:ABC transporter ATP-binding protein [Oscillospiraceae bacterium]
MRWIIKQVKKIWLGLLAQMATGMVISLMGVYFALLSKKVLDVATGQVPGDLLQTGLILFVFLALQLILEVILSVLNVHVSGRFYIALKTELFTQIMRKDYMQITGYHTGELLNRINSDVGIVADGLLQMLPNFVFYLTKIVACFLALYILDPFFSLLCLLLGPLIFFTGCLYRKQMKKLHKDCQEADGRNKSFMQETLKNLLVIKSFGRGRMAAQKSRLLQWDAFKLSIKRNKISIAANILFYVGLTVGYYLALTWGAYKISVGVMTFGTLTALLQLVNQIQTPFQGLSSLLPQYFAMLASAERLVELEKLPEDKTENRIEWKEASWSHVALRDVCYAYQSEKVLEDTDFDIHHGEFIVITGMSGTGKSTLLKVLLGILTPQSGEMVLRFSDGSSIPLADEDKRLFSYVPQGNLIVSGTIRENILFFKTNVPEEQVVEAAKTAQIWDMISELPQGLDTVLGEGGLGLSEGQIQRLAIARAVLSDAPVLLLDEATSALDEATELAILDALKQRQDKTCVLVSHKKAALSFCDAVYQFEDGHLMKQI